MYKIWKNYKGKNYVPKEWTTPSCGAKALLKTGSWSPGMALAIDPTTHPSEGSIVSLRQKGLRVEMSPSRKVRAGLAQRLSIDWTKGEGPWFSWPEVWELCYSHSTSLIFPRTIRRIVTKNICNHYNTNVKLILVDKFKCKIHTIR
jgi:hypothetical protein